MMTLYRRGVPGNIQMGTSQCDGKLAGHKLLDWSFYALILVFPVIWYFIFGSWFKSQLGSLVSAAKDRIWIFFGFEKIATIRRRGAHIANVVPGPKPRTGFGGRDVKHCLLLWWYAVGTDQAFQEVHCNFFGI
jgi:hypothetical protein